MSLYNVKKPYSSLSPLVLSEKLLRIGKDPTQVVNSSFLKFSFLPGSSIVILGNKHGHLFSFVDRLPLFIFETMFAASE